MSPRNDTELVGEWLERGLELYGAGDVAGAISSWRQALAQDPSNTRACDYLEYIEEHLEIARGPGGSEAELRHAFGLEELKLANLSSDELEAYESLEFVEEEKAEGSASVRQVDDGWTVEGSNPSVTRGVGGAKGSVGQSTEPRPLSATFDLGSFDAAREQEMTLDIVDASDEPRSIDVTVSFEPRGETAQKQPASDWDETSFADINAELDLEMDSLEETIDRVAQRKEPVRPRAPTVDPGIPLSSVQVDDALLSLEQATEEFHLPDLDLELGSYENKSGALHQGETKVYPDAIPELRAKEEEIVTKVAPERTPVSVPIEGEVAQGPAIETEEVLGASKSLEANSNDAAGVVSRLLEHADDAFRHGQQQSAANAVGQALSWAAKDAAAQKLVHESEPLLLTILLANFGDVSQILHMGVPMEQIPMEELDHRTAFLLTRIDGTFSLDEILDVCGMPRLEALGHLSRLYQRGFLEIA